MTSRPSTVVVEEPWAEASCKSLLAGKRLGYSTKNLPRFLAYLQCEFEQSPEAGDFVKEKRKIYLTLNPSKYRDITVTDLNGRTKRQAISELQAIGFIVGTN